MISRGALSGAILLVPTCAFMGILNGAFSEFGIYACLGLFLLLGLVHLFFRDESFDNLKAINLIIWIILPWLVILSLYAFLLEAYLAMFISLGFFFVFYLIHLMEDFLNLDEEKTA